MAKNSFQRLVDSLFGETVQLNLSAGAPSAAPEEKASPSGLTILDLSGIPAHPAPPAALQETAPVSEPVFKQVDLLHPESKAYGAGTGVEVIDLGAAGAYSQLERKITVRLLRNYAKNSTWVRAAIDYRREKIGRAHPELVPRDSTRKPSRLDKRVRAEVEKLIRTPNEAGESYGLLKEKMLEDYYVIGHGCLELGLYNDLTVRELTDIDAARIGFNRKWDGKRREVPRFVEFENASTSKIKRYLANEQLMCLINRPMSDSKMGLSHVEILHLTVMALLSGNELLLKQIVQPVSEKLISLGEGTTQQQAESFKYQLNQVRDKLAVISGAKDPKVLNLSGSAEEMKVLDGQVWFVRQVAAIFNISTAKLKLAVDTSRANTGEMMADDLEALEGDLNRIIELENAALVDRWEYLGEVNLEFSYPIMHRKDEKQQALIAKQQTGQPWGSMNEARRRTGEKALDEKEFPFADEPIVNTKQGPVPYSIWVKQMEELEKNIGKELPAPAPPAADPNADPGTGSPTNSSGDSSAEQ